MTNILYFLCSLVFVLPYVEVPFISARLSVLFSIVSFVVVCLSLSKFGPIRRIRLYFFDALVILYLYFTALFSFSQHNLSSHLELSRIFVFFAVYYAVRFSNLIFSNFYSFLISIGAIVAFLSSIFYFLKVDYFIRDVGSGRLLVSSIGGDPSFSSALFSSIFIISLFVKRPSFINQVLYRLIQLLLLFQIFLFTSRTGFVSFALTLISFSIPNINFRSSSFTNFKVCIPKIFQESNYSPFIFFHNTLIFNCSCQFY